MKSGRALATLVVMVGAYLVGPGCLAKFDNDYPLGERERSVGGTAGAASGCEVTSDCAGGRVCDPHSGQCVECVRSADCESGEQCSGNYCVPEGAAGSGAGAGGGVGDGGTSAGGIGGESTSSGGGTATAGAAGTTAGTGGAPVGATGGAAGSGTGGGDRC